MDCGELVVGWQMRSFFRFHNILDTLNLMLRAAVWKSTPQSSATSLPTLIVCTLAWMAIVLIREYLAAGTAARFSPYGLNACLAIVLVTFAVTAMFVAPRDRTTVLCALIGFGAVIELTALAFVLGGKMLVFTVKAPSFWTSRHAAILIFLIYVIALVWWIGAMSAIFRSVEPQRRWAIPRACALWFALLVTVLVMPYFPTFRGRDFDIRRANYWEYISAYLDGRFDNKSEPHPRVVDDEQVELSQAALLGGQISRLSPQVKGKTDIYVIGLAGSDMEDVFVKELQGGLDSLGHVFPVDGRVLRLINHPDTVNTIPVASRQNFAAAVHAVARIMDRNEDVLLLFMTSHGSRDGVSLWLPDLVWGDLSPASVAKVLDQEHIKNRIVIVSACYSGVFVKPLANDHTIILTAADENHPSFGCSNEREWTYFGDALFNHSLRPGVTVEEAFLDAKAAIAQWEDRDGLTHSNPQGYFGSALMKKLTPLYLASKNAMNAETGVRR